ncbi:NADH:ubiquinone reductase (Na(+)-transporting) subunit C [Flavobacterium cellulosilyticum]|uniref:Na(+)-translocating NADH-quinone reductase subunit C n=1 Tax=Flavobacterium cellulosilyticum TaxID=2541731 RepID=A0A4R5C4U1_9FLAO|nr:NADH:ubiquinone reductase (Na(+)-transporting) subunit C [Flavobacterium cellulosilyticum]TDD94731.1 NADH:ubiquinone reductase (Na(+)-transporting) subunit C [Flavobacterium cellulosilyticum]
MNKDSNKATFLFSTVLVVIIAVLLSITAISLAPYQAKNIRIEKMKNILTSVDIHAETAETEQLYTQYITQQIVLNNKGEEVKGGVAAFDIDLKKELDKAKTGKTDEQLFPLFICNKEGKKYYIIPVRGKGLWGPIWGYLSLEPDKNTIYGASFGHKSETPGLGAEIETEKFQHQFIGKTIFDESGNFVSVTVIKGGASPNDTHGVDAISGATITSKGVSEMFKRTLSNYIPYFKSR